MPDFDPADLLGVWHKATSDACAEKYPAVLDVRDGGMYFAPGGPEAGAYWHGGDWSVDHRSLIVQVANDRNVPYEVVEVTGDVFTLEDDENCRFTYRRER